MIDLRAVLQAPQIYQTFQVTGGFFGARLLSMSRYLYFRERDRVVDVGCGPGYMRKHIPLNCTYFGYDTDETYIQYAERRKEPNSTYHLGMLGQAEFDAIAPVDVVLMCGLLHHLTDNEARTLLAMSWAALNPGGRIFSLDGCYVPDQSFFKRKLLDWDRGEHVRDQQSYLKLFPVEALLDSHVDENLSLVPYTWLTCVARKEPPH